MPGLANVMFHERLGSVLNKVVRLQALAEFCGAEAGLSTAQSLPGRLTCAKPIC